MNKDEELFKLQIGPSIYMEYSELFSYVIQDCVLMYDRTKLL